MTAPDAMTRYRAFCQVETGLPIFLNDWWLDAACGPDEWSVALHERGGEVEGVLPFRRGRRGGFVVLGQPPLTQFLGPWIRPTAAKTADRLAREKDIMGELIAQLPPHARYAQNWSPEVSNWLPFYWRGFSQTTRYSYVLRSPGEGGFLQQDLQANARTDIRKAVGRFGVRLRKEPSLDAFLELQEKTFSRQGRKLPYPVSLVERIDQACEARARRRIFIAEDGEGRAHAGAYVVWDAKSAYYLMGGGDPEVRNSGATSFCLWEAIQFAGRRGLDFDFEGSMIEPIERFFRSFGAQQLPYFHVSRTPSRLLRLALALRGLKG